MTVDQLHIKYGLVDRKKDFEIIDFFEQNALIIQNLDEKKDEETLTAKMVLFSDYAYVIAKNGQWEKSIPLLRESIRLQELHPNFEGHKKESKQYEHLLLKLGDSLYKTARIEDSRTVFQTLVTLVPNNNAYKSWIIGTSNHFRNKINKYLFAALIGWIIIAVLFRSLVPTQLDLIFKLTGVMLLFLTATIEVLNYRTKRKYK